MPKKPVNNQVDSNIAFLLRELKLLENASLAKHGGITKAYWDVNGWRIGYGTPALSKNEILTEKEAAKRLEQEIVKRRQEVINYSAAHKRNWTDGQVNALTLFHYNIGSLDEVTQEGRRTDSDIAKYIKKYVYVKGRYSSGLKQRREREALLFTQHMPKRVASSALTDLAVPEQETPKEQPQPVPTEQPQSVPEEQPQPVAENQSALTDTAPEKTPSVVPSSETVIGETTPNTGTVLASVAPETQFPENEVNAEATNLFDFSTSTEPMPFEGLESLAAYYLRDQEEQVINAEDYTVTQKNSPEFTQTMAGMLAFNDFLTGTDSSENPVDTIEEKIKAGPSQDAQYLSSKLNFALNGKAEDNLQALTALGVTPQELSKYSSEQISELLDNVPELAAKNPQSVVELARGASVLMGLLINQTVNPFEKRQLESYAAHLVTEIYKQSRGTLEATGDFIGNALGWFGASALANAANKGFLDSITNLDEIEKEYQNYAIAWDRMTEEERVMMLPGLFHSIYEKTDNWDTAMEVFSTVVGDLSARSGIRTSQFWLGLEFVPGIGLAGPVAQAAKGAVKGSFNLGKTIIAGNKTRNLVTELSKLTRKENQKFITNRIKKFTNDATDKSLTAAERAKAKTELIKTVKIANSFGADIASKLTPKTTVAKVKEASDSLLAQMVEVAKQRPTIALALRLTYDKQVLFSLPFKEGIKGFKVAPEVARKTILQSVRSDAAEIEKLATTFGSAKEMQTAFKDGAVPFLKTQFAKLPKGLRTEIENMRAVISRDSWSSLVPVDKEGLKLAIGDDKQFVELLTDRAAFSSPTVTALGIKPQAFKKVMLAAERKIVGESDNAIEVQVTIPEKFAPKGTALKNRTLTFDLNVSLKEVNLDLGSESVLKDLGGMGRKLRSIHASLGKLPEAVGRYLRGAGSLGERQTSKIKQNFARIFEVAQKNLSSAERQKVWSALAEDSLVEKPISYADIKAKAYTFTNGQKITTRFLSDKEIAGYFRLREALNHMWTVQNQAVRRNLTLQGLVSVDLRVFKNTAATGEKLYLHPDNIGGIFVKEKSYTSLLKTKAAQVWDAFKGKSTTVNKQLLSDIKDGKVKLYRVAKSQEDTSSSFAVHRSTKTYARSASGMDKLPVGAKWEHYEYIVVPNSNRGFNNVVHTITQLPDQVLKFRPNYLPLVRDNVNFVIKSAQKVSLNGRLVTKELTRGFAGTKESAIRIAQDLDLDPAKAVSVSTERMVAEFDQVTTGARTLDRAEGAAFSYDEHVKTLNPAEAVIQMTSRVSRSISYNEFKEVVAESFLKNYKHLLENPRDFNSPIATKFKTGSAKGKAIPADIREGLEILRNDLKVLLTLPTRDEQTFSRAAEKLAEVLDPATTAGLPNKARGWMASKLYSNKTGDLFAPIKAFTYLAAFAFNFAQFIVQAGMLYRPLLLHPVFFLKAMPRYVAFRTALLDGMRYGTSTGLRAVGDLTATLAKKAKIPVSHFEEMVKLFEESGMRASLFDAADIPNLMKPSKYNATQHAANVAGFFYKEGDLLGRIIGFDVAAGSAVKRLGKPLSQFTKEERFAVVRSAIDFSGEFGRSNRAWWQRNGFTALPTQFMQVMTKEIEDVILGSTKRFSKKERAILALGTLALFGSRGTPMQLIPDATAEMWAEQMGLNPRENPEHSAFIRQGIQGLIQSWIFGRDIVDLSPRLSILSGLKQLTDVVDKVFPIFTMMFGQDASFNYSIGRPGVGAFLTNILNTKQALSTTIDLLTLPYSMNDTVWGDDKELGTVWTLIAEEWTNIPSAARNYKEAATWLRTGAIRDSQGRALFDSSSTAFTSDVVVKMLGFEPTDVAVARTLSALKGTETGIMFTSFGKSREDMLRNIVVKILRDPKRYNLNIANSVIAILTEGMPADKKVTTVQSIIQNVAADESSIQEEWVKTLYDIAGTPEAELDTERGQITTQKEWILNHLQKANSEKTLSSEDLKEKTMFEFLTSLFIEGND